MDYFPIFLATAGRRIVLSGGGSAALAKLRLLLKTTANLTVFAPNAAPEIKNWAASGKLTLIPRAMEPGDTMCAVIFYAADQYAMARRTGFDEVEITQDLAARQPQEQWQFRADWKDNDYQARMRG